VADEYEGGEEVDDEEVADDEYYDFGVAVADFENEPPPERRRRPARTQQAPAVPMETESESVPDEEIPSEHPVEKELDAFDYAWFAAPVLLGLLGGIFGFLAVKGRKKNPGKWMLILGALFSLIWFAGGYGYY